MVLKEIVQKLEAALPLSWAESWDNSGLLVGDLNSEVSSASLVTDISEAAITHAAELDCTLLMAHHPIIFKSLKSILSDTPVGRTVTLALKSGMALYAAHTNWDSSPEGVNVVLARLLSLKNAVPLTPAPAGSGAFGIGVVGYLDEPLHIEDFLDLIKKSWGLSHCFGYGDAGRMLYKVALGGGSCGDMWPLALAAGADIFATSDITYHQRLDALNSGLSLAVTDHGETERASLPALKSLIERETSLPVSILPEERSWSVIEK